MLVTKKESRLIINNVHIYSVVVRVRDFLAVGVDDDSSAAFVFGNAVSGGAEIEDLRQNVRMMNQVEQ